ncbi:uncharacterized protein [Montipora foliosa]|uniref:uncharacterized protein n=1 Tax=Montipora foliosa TaxID=591990 RepID=UPI0035F141C6
MRGADVSSDHHLFLTALRFRLKRVTNIKNTRTKYHVGLLRNKDTQTAFNISLSNRYQLLQDLIDPETDIKIHWEYCKKIWHDTCEECLGRKMTQHKDWITADTIRKLEARKAKNTALNTIRTRAAKTRAQAEYAAADREVKRKIKKDKRDHIDDLASQAETAAWQGNRKDLYLMTKKLLGKFQQKDKPVRHENRNPLTTTEDQLKRWAEHVGELLNRPAPHHQTSRTQRKNYNNQKGHQRTREEEGSRAGRGTSRSHQSRHGNSGRHAAQPLQQDLGRKMPKNVDPRNCSNYQGIMLLSKPGKVLNRVLPERMKEASARTDPVRTRLPACASLQSSRFELNSPLCINVIDYEKAFDSGDRETL